MAKRSKFDFKNFINLYTKEIFLDYYNTHTYNDTLQHFNITDTNLKFIKNMWGISAKTTVYKLKSERDNSKLKEAKSKHFNAIKLRISRETLYQYYIVEDHSYQETPAHFNLTFSTFDKLCREYDIKKDRKKTIQKSLATKYENAGDKETYYKNIVNKRETTFENNFGSLDNYYKQRQEKIEQTNINRYGAKYKATADLKIEHSELYSKLWDSKEESIEYLKSFLPNKITVEELMIQLNCSINNVYLWVEKFQLSSYIKCIKTHYEDDIIEFIRNLGINNIIKNSRKILPNNLELDIYIPDNKLAIEFNGTYWHSNQIKEDKEYHFKKSYECEKSGIRLIHIYQYQWEDNNKREILKSIIKNALNKNTNIVYARKCEIKELKTKDVIGFSNKNSLHAHRVASIYLGLFYNNELVELMSFGKAFFSRDNSINYECIRSITKLNTTVIGGMNKLFKYFINKYNPNKILYYVDYNTHVGNSMSKLGFKFISYSKYGTINISNCKETIDKYGYVFNRKPQKHKEIQKYINEGKILTIYDAGVKKYIWSSINY